MPIINSFVNFVEIKKVIVMKKLLLLVLSFYAGLTNASVLTFDDVSPTGFNDVVYHEFTLLDGAIGFWDYINPDPYSGDQYMVNHNGDRLGQLTINSGTFDFNGAFFHQDNRVPGLSVDLFGLNGGGDVLYSTTISPTDDWTYYELNWTDITTFKWTPNGGANINIDNFTYNADISAVPLPAAIWLFGSALAGFAGISRYKKKS